MHFDPNYVYKMHFYNRISLTSFFDIWEGKTWSYVHMDVYNDDNISYFKSLNCSAKEKTSFTDDEVMRFRQQYMNETVEEIYNSENIHCKFNTFKSIVYGDTYKHLPIYKKNQKIWINK